MSISLSLRKGEIIPKGSLWEREFLLPEKRIYNSNFLRYQKLIPLPPSLRK
jgi:hypothetical protein